MPGNGNIKDALKEGRLKQKLEKMLAIHAAIYNLNITLSSLTTEEEREEEYKQNLANYAKEIISLSQDDKDSLLFPGGWTAKPAGHAMVYEFKKGQRWQSFISCA